LPENLGGYTIGVLVQTNFGGVLQIAGVPVGKLLESYVFRSSIQDSGDGSCMMIVATDAPLSPRNLKRLAKRAMLGLARTGGIASNGSGDYVIAFSTYDKNFMPYQSNEKVSSIDDLRNSEVSPLFLATIEATEEAIINSLFAAKYMEGRDGHVIEALPKDKVLKLLKKYRSL
jgi:D-aminopeptidase